MDLFWVRKLDVPPGTRLVKTDAERLETTIQGFLVGGKDPQGAVDRQIAEQAANAPQKPMDATVRFVPDHSGGLATLEVGNDGDRSGSPVAFARERSIFGQRVQIVRVREVRTVEDRARLRPLPAGWWRFDGTPSQQPGRASGDSGGRAECARAGETQRPAGFLSLWLASMMRRAFLLT